MTQNKSIPPKTDAQMIAERGGEWRILNRVIVFDWVEYMPLPKGTEAERFGAMPPIGAQYPHDPLYQNSKHI